MRQKLQEFGAAEEAADNVLLVLDEIVSNAIEHGDEYRKAEETRLVVRLEARDRDVVIEFEDPDVPPDVVEELTAALRRGVDRPPVESERGRGLFLISHCLDELRIGPRQDGGLLLYGCFAGALA